ncbi:MAG TPA: hypothetical protein VMW41_06005 [Candidatus Bathyarchaeia archaeon]|nr:hypothetical protein [Candidatus Bathyarchaeia archaeon]
MTYQHQSLSSGRWKTLSFIEQMANIGSEVERTISWKKKGNNLYSQKAFFRTLELLDLTIEDAKNKDRLRELTRLREVLVDYFFGENQFSSSDKLWHNYFYAFNYAASLNSKYRVPKSSALESRDRN